MMTEILQKLYNLQSNLEEALSSGEFRTNVLSEVRNKLKLYIKRLFKDNSTYNELVDEIDINPKNSNSFNSSMNQLRSVILAIIEDVQISKTDLSIVTENEKQEILSKARKEIEYEKERIEIQAKEIEKIKDDLQKRTESILLEEEKFNSFKTKLELADKGIDFQTDAKANKKNASFWSIIIIILLLILLTLICYNLNSISTFSEIAKNVKSQLSIKDLDFDNDFITTTIYISFAKMILSRLFIYSLLVYSIRFAVKNYNAQMHNFIINSHKANSLKSTLSLLGTAKSDEGNDRLLVQATQAIFSHQNTGFNNKETDLNSPNLITNVIDSVSKKI